MIDPRKYQERGRGVRTEREGNKYRYRLSCGQLGLGPEGELWEMMWDVPQSCPSQWAQKQDINAEKSEVSAKGRW